MSGFSLIELVISVGIFILIVLAITALFFTHDTLFSAQQTTVEVIGSASALASDIQVMTQQADQVLSSHAFSGVTYTTSTSTLVLRLPSIDSSGDPIPSTYDYVAYYATGTSAYRLVDAGAGSVRIPGSKQLSNAITTFTFTYDNINTALVSSVGVDIATEKAAKREEVDTHVSQTVYLRNK